MLRKGYYYIFYKLYRGFNSEDFKWIPEVRTYTLLLIIGSLGFDAVTSFIAVLINKEDLLRVNAKVFYTTFYVLFAIFNYIVFLHNNKWKRIIESFSKMDKKKNLLGTIVVYSVILCIVILWILSMYIWPDDGIPSN